jgi:GT2 family glycosyltransferase
LLADCLDSLAADPPSTSYEVLLVDNGSSDGTPDMVRERYPQVRIVPNERNLGFSGGNMLAAQHASGRLLLLLNPDTVVLPGAIDELLAALDADARNHVAGACLLQEDGSPGSSWGDFPTVGWAVANTAPWNWLGVKPRSRSRMGSTCADLEGVAVVDWVSGAAFLVRRDVWNALGGLDEGYFMYFEETDLCHRVREAGGRVVVVPSARIVHREGGTVGVASTRQRVWFTAGMIRFFGRTRGVLPAAVVRAWILFVNASLWLLSWPLGLFAMHGRDNRHRYGALVRTALGLRVDLTGEEAR